MPKVWEPLFPDLGGWTETSPRTPEYNCFAFVVGDEERRWEPFVYYWPPNVPRGYDIDKFIRAYETVGFRQCDDGSLVEGIEKIALFTKEHGGVFHAARQETDGKWKSKMGDEEDILHDSPQSLEGNEYGYPGCFMQRERRTNVRAIKESETSVDAAQDSASSGVSKSTHQD
ncbi:MAG TPA: hypothetical protein VKS24_08100 [Bradyrhizobium sp.]|nr:hypothetical protein [Bradyrhizobium sp.]